jgi:O-antigen/teichoic acid export membrane protein
MVNARSLFVFVNVAINLMFLLRSYITMRSLAYSDLGLVALMQTIILLVAALQFGVVNGGYRLVCSESEAGVRVVNNLVYSFTGGLAALLFAVGGLTAAMSADRSYVIVIPLAIFAGVLTILKNWITNFLIAKVMLPTVNFINLVSALASVAPLAWVSVNPLLICLISIIAQPLIFVAYALIFCEPLRPTALEFRGDVFKRIMSAGFVVFLTGIFLVVNGQIERWSILSYLGRDGLGRFYLALVFLNLYTLVPTSLDAIYLPKLIQSYANLDFARVRIDMRKFLLVLVLYSAAVIACVFLAAPPFLKAFLPKYIDDLRFVYMVLPGAVLFGLTGPFAIVFNVLIQYRYYFYAYGMGTLATAILLGAYIYGTDAITLAAVAIIKSIVSISMGAVIVAGYFVCTREAPAFRLTSPGLRDSSAI